ncbi:hypothetical protein E3E26_09170 [Thermococcus sp. LS1]|uniref:hypothetical protein n=1 Tax=Thermococcus sp. LS1 TaxID=1638259 RepID=UPI00143AC13A|nr:hypothetical protein [Thermococcus sp. LS1]NJD99946.1 hypothetical protein [Thermococcus sp. LS1]
MTFKDPPLQKILKSTEFMKQAAFFTSLCVGRFFFPHSEIDGAFSSQFYQLLTAYFIITLGIVFSYELLHDLFPARRDEFSRATQKEKWELRLLISGYFAFLLATPRDEKLTLIIAWIFGIMSAYIFTKIRMREFQ